jgi:hypothetical protein
VADHPPPPRPPQDEDAWRLDPERDLRQSALRDLAQAQRNRVLFIEAMADPLRRGIAFEVVERNCRERFAEGEDGIELFLQLLRTVQSAGVDEAVEEFERRFAPMLDQELLQGPAPTPSE